MGKLFGKLTSTDNMEQAQDRLGGSFDALPTDVYEATIKMAFVTQSDGGATAMNLVLDINGKEVKFQEWVTNKKGENFFKDKEDPKKIIPLPGFTTVNDIALFTTELPLMEQDFEDKIVKVYDPKERKEVNTSCPCMTAAHGKKIKLAILREVVNSQKKDDSGEYVDQFNDDGTPKTRTQNTIDKVFHPETNRTINEYLQEVDPGEFMPAWLERNKGKDRNKVKKADGAAGGASGSGRPNPFAGKSADGGAPKSGMFAKK